MSWGNFTIVAIFTLLNFLFLDFPAAKIIVYVSFLFLFLNYLYYRFVLSNINVERGNKDYFLFSGISENSVIKVKNKLFFPVHAITVKDQSDLNIAVRQVYSFLVSLDSREEKSLFYTICGKKRGLYIIGPTTVNFVDLAGIFSFEIELDTRKEITVFPNIYVFSDFPYKSLQPQGNFRNKLPIYEDVSLIKGVKEYQPGDELKRINWKISARQDKILVNTYQFSISVDSFVVLNLSKENYNFREKDYYIELAIDIASSIVYYLEGKKQNYGIVSNGKLKNDESLYFPMNNGNMHLIDIISSLSIILPSDNKLFIESLKELTNLKWGTSIYIITPELNEEEIAYLIEINKKGHPINIFNLGPRIDRELDLSEIGFSRYYVDVENGIVKILSL